VTERWYKQAVIYCLDVETFQDSDGDGVGDLRGLMSRLDYLARLGVTCIWLNPIHPSPNRDDGYDVSGFYGVDPRIGTLGDFVELVHQCDNRGLRLIIDLVVNHTSDQHPWFQQARSDPDSAYRDWYLWAKTEPATREEGEVFPGYQRGTWSFDEEAQLWYHHRFYDFQPDLNWSNPAVRNEIGKVVAFWLQLGVSGFRMDAAPFVIEEIHPDTSDRRFVFDWLNDLHDHMAWRRGDAIVLAEANVDRSLIPEFFGPRGDRIQMLFNFLVNPRLLLALARNAATPLVTAIESSPPIPDQCGWATFLRNHDEADLSRLLDSERADVLAAFGPEEDMQLYGRGIRRRLAPMLGNDRRRMEMAYVLQFTLPGTPVLRYGQEIGMGDDLSLPQREAIRTPMQWSDTRQAGFTSSDKPIRPVISTGEYGQQKVNVTAQQSDPDSLLSWFERMLRTLRECPEFGEGQVTVLDPGLDTVLALRFQSPAGTIVTTTNLVDEPCMIDLSPLAGAERPMDVFGNRRYDPAAPELSRVDLDGWGYRWIRLSRATRG